jgi:prepilin-type N-terminal cleavage/methylation domain-containing protein
MRSQQSGFTLIEIAIVLVIIGLLLGGVLKGQELINSAKIKNVANDLNGISAAVYSYQDRYKTYPGDDNGAVARWATARDGNKDGIVTGEFCEDPVVGLPAAAPLGETIKFWQHLRLAGFVGGDTASGEQPQNALGGIVGVQTAAGDPAAVPPAVIDIGGFVVCTSNLSGKIAEAIDRQFDDGLPNRGTLRAFTQNRAPVARGCTAANNVTRQASVATYNAADDTELYTICKSL